MSIASAAKDRFLGGIRPGVDATVSRRRLAAIISGVALLSLVVGLVAGRTMLSPADRAARIAPPTASLITAQVEKRVLSSQVVVRGDVTFSDSVPLKVASLEAVLTEPPPAVGSEIREGEVALEIGERPILVLAGNVPMYRDILSGSTGIDVLQLEEALARLGYNPGKVDGVFNAQTGKALSDLYAANGYAAPKPTPEDESRLSAARMALHQAEDASAAPSSEAAIAEASANLQGAEGAVVVARASASAMLAAAEAGFEEAVIVKERARNNQLLAQTRRDQAEAGRHPDTGEQPSPSDLEELRRVEALASDALRIATAQQQAAGAARDATIQQADQEVTNALAQVEVARARLAEASSPTSNRSAAASLRSARDDLARLEQELAPGAKRNEIAFVPVLPATFTAINVSLGQQADGILGEISGSRLVVRAGLSKGDQDLLEVGDEATLESVDPELKVSGKIVELLDSGSVDGAGIVVQVDDPAALQLRGLNVKLNIPVDTTDGEVLVVPVAALASDPDGTAHVEIEESAGSTKRVKVRTGLVADGNVEISALDGSDLSEGDRVVVGSRALS